MKKLNNFERDKSFVCKDEGLKHEEGGKGRRGRRNEGGRWRKEGRLSRRRKG